MSGDREDNAERTARFKRENPLFWRPVDRRYTPPDCGGPYHGRKDNEHSN